jgi:peptidoglycan hydrolase-like protein with peptidoglycan-binding domain/LysM repeat protein
MTYDPKFSQKQMYDQYGRSRESSKPNPGKQFADSMKAGGGGRNMSGIGAKPVSRPFDRGSTYDEVPTPSPSKPEDPSNIEKVKNKFVDLMKFFGGDDPKETKVDGKAVYKGPMFTNTPIDIDAQMARIRDAVDYSKAPPPIYRGDIPNDYNMRYDVVPPASANKNLMQNAVNKFLRQKGLNSREYTIQRGDTLSEIAQREGLKVSDLVKINKIENKNRIYAGETLIIPTPQEVERVRDIVDTMDPDAQFYQSGVPLDQRVFEPELGYDEIPLPSQATVDRRTSKGLGVIPEVTVTELDDYVAAEDTTRTSDDISAPDYATMSFGEAGRPDTGGIMSPSRDTRYFESGRGFITETAAGKEKAIQKRLNDLDYNAGKVDGAIGGGSKRAIRKFQKQHGFEPTGNLDAEQYNLLISDEAEDYPDPEKPDAKVKTLDSETLKVAREALAFIESGTHGYSTYAYDVPAQNKKKGDPLEGGANNHYLGKYQMGRDAMIDGGYLKNKDEYDDEKKKMRAGKPNKLTTFLNTPSLQDKAWKKYTEENHDTLTKKSERYRNMSMQEKLGVLGYAHNQGATAAVEWLFTGVSGKDKNGTLGTKYTNDIAEAIASSVYGIMP